MSSESDEPPGSPEQASSPAGMSFEQMEAARRARLRADYQRLKPAERVEQVIELSRQLGARSGRER